MKKLFWYSVIPMTLIVLSSCGKDFPPDRRQFAPPVAGNGQVTTLVTPVLSSARQGCKPVSDKGCISGQVIVAPYIYLDGKKYFDAEDLGRLFTDMVMLHDQSGAPLLSSHYQIEIAPKIDNESFLEEFKVYAKGTYAAQANLSSTGLFVLQGLEAGVYDLRVQKSFTMRITSKPPVANDPIKSTTPIATKDLPPVTKDPTTSTTPIATKDPTPPTSLLATEQPTAQRDQPKVYCFTVYAQEDQMQIDGGQMMHKVFDHFKLHMIDKECDKDINAGPTLTM